MTSSGKLRFERPYQGDAAHGTVERRQEARQRVADEGRMVLGD